MPQTTQTTIFCPLALEPTLERIGTFNEGKGNVVHDEVDSATDVLIPERFFVPRQQFLEPPGDEFRSDWRY
jgi:hypothetical protein